MIYLDYDGVVGDTEIGLFDGLYEQRKRRPTLTKVEYLVAFDWRSWLRKSGPKRDAFRILKSHDPDNASILTRCWSASEAKEKILYIRENGIENAIIIVPCELPKTKIVRAKGNILVEDQIGNIIDWQREGGIGLMLADTAFEECESIKTIEEAFCFEKRLRGLE